MSEVTANTQIPGAEPLDTKKTELNLIINYIPNSLSEDVLRGMFAPYGTILQCKIIKDRTTGSSLGYGFVLYDSQEAGHAAIAGLNGHNIENKRLKVSIARPSGGSSDSSGSSREQKEGTNLYFCGLPDHMTQDMLTSLISPFGTLTDSRVLTNQSTGKAKGIAFARFSTVDESKACIEALHGTTPDGYQQSLTVKFADTPSQSQQRRQTASSSSYGAVHSHSNNRYNPMGHRGGGGPSHRGPPSHTQRNHHYTFGQQHPSSQPSSYQHQQYPPVNYPPSNAPPSSAPAYTPPAWDPPPSSYPASQPSYPPSQQDAYPPALSGGYNAPNSSSYPPPSSSSYPPPSSSSYPPPSSYPPSSYPPASQSTPSQGSQQAYYNPASGQAYLLQPGQGQQAASAQPNKDYGGVCLFVYHLPASATEEVLQTLFANYGSVLSTKIMKDLETGRGKGFGFVNMGDDQQAQLAIQSLNGYQMGSKYLKVSYKK